MSWIRTRFSGEGTARGDLLLLASVILVSYSPTLFSGLVSDDLMLLRRARETPWSLAELANSFRFGAADMTDGYTPYNFPQFELHFFRPLYMAIMKLEYLVFGAWGGGYHVTNLILHFAVTTLLYFWTADFGFDRRKRLLAALLFAVFVPNSFTVAWVSGRTELLAATLVILSIMFMGRFYAQGKPWQYGVSFGAYLLALCSKESAVILPFWHALALLFLYPPQQKSLAAFARRFAVISPLFLMLAPYFVIRNYALGGFPLPPEGMFYYHQPSDPDFLPFLISRIYHAPLALFLQWPTFIVPSLFERCAPLLWIMPVIAVVFAVAILRWLPSPFRYFFACWIAFALAPTLNIGFNPVYFYMCSLVVPIAYLYLRDSLDASPRPWARKVSNHGVKVLVGYGVLYGFVSSLLFGLGSLEARTAATDLARILREKPAATNVYIFDVPWSQNTNIVPGARLLDESFARRRIMLMNPSIDAQGGTPSEVVRVDDKTLECRAQGGTYFTTGIEQAAFAEDIIPIVPGLRGEHEVYSVEIAEVAPSDALRRESEVAKAIRDFLQMPAREQVGATVLRYTLTKPLDSSDNLFLQMRDGRIHEIEDMAVR
ncbi:MAG: hypothetical protein JNK74_09135 [Candidatus Hydrogenedentes bacterium]|nr:hypothetical protein [Candidatus Hydrogenedentota bacterium]